MLDLKVVLKEDDILAEILEVFGPNTCKSYYFKVHKHEEQILKIAQCLDSCASGNTEEHEV